MQVTSRLLEDYISSHALDDDIVKRLRRLPAETLSLVMSKDLSTARNPSAVLNMVCNRYETAWKALPSLADAPCQVCDDAPGATKRRPRAEKRRANRINKAARLDRLLDSILCSASADPQFDNGLVNLLDMMQPLRCTGTPSEGRVVWQDMSDTCDPFRTAPRMADTPCGKRKRESVEAFAWLLEEILLPGVRAARDGMPSSSAAANAAVPTIVDAGCSTGSLILPLAHAFPDAHFVGIDVKASSLALLKERAAAAGLSARVSTWEGRIEEYDGPCDVVVSLHACGGASDAALQLATRYAPADSRAAPFAVSPCCVGALPFGIRSLGGKKEGSEARGAASAWLCAYLLKVVSAEGNDAGNAAACEADFFALLAASAGSDGSALQGMDSEDGGGQAAARRRRSKRVVEIDRLAAMPGDGLGGILMRIAGEAMGTTSSLTDVLVGPPAALSMI